jgi:hypothetical protein
MLLGLLLLLLQGSCWRLTSTTPSTIAGGTHS